MDIKKKILESIAYVRKDMGWTLVSEDWGSAKHKCACALACVLLQDKPEDTVRVESGREAYLAVAELLGVTEQWVDGFIEGFDVNGTALASNYPEAWEVGFAVAKASKPIPYHKWDGNP